LHIQNSPLGIAKNNPEAKTFAASTSGHPAKYLTFCKPLALFRVIDNHFLDVRKFRPEIPEIIAMTAA
jgi:hypothetical protein